MNDEEEPQIELQKKSKDNQLNNADFSSNNTDNLQNFDSVVTNENDQQDSDEEYDQSTSPNYLPVIQHDSKLLQQTDNSID